MNTFLNGLKKDTNYNYTTNGALTYRSTLNSVLDLFALGGSFRSRSDEDCIKLFRDAYEEDKTLALKCLFYLRDVRGGQGERRFFRVCFRWLAEHDTQAALRNLINVSEYGRWDDLLYATAGTKVQKEALYIIKNQLKLDAECKTPSLLAKWLPSENASSKETKQMGNLVRTYLGLTHKQYRQILSILRKRINIVERLMSENRWDEIEFDKLPSRAGLIYRNAFARRDIIAKKYEAFAKSDKKVNADVLNPVDIAKKIFAYNSARQVEDTERAMFQKYWDNLKDYYNGREENGLAIVDVSGSMWGTPLCAAVSMGAYVAERGHGPFANHFITFSGNPQLVKFSGDDITDKFFNCINADWGWDTNIEKVFNMLLRVAEREEIKPEDMPTRLYIFSDMAFNEGLNMSEGETNTLLESIAAQWKRKGYELPQVIFWNLNAFDNTIPALGDRFGYISGSSMSIIEAVLSGKTGVDLMLEKINSPRYDAVK